MKKSILNIAIVFSALNFVSFVNAQWSGTNPLSTSSRVNINSTTTTSALYIYNGESSSYESIMRIANFRYTGNTGARLQLYMGRGAISDNNPPESGDTIGVLEFVNVYSGYERDYGFFRYTALGSNQTGYFSFEDKDNNELMVIDTSTGDVGIAENLDVVGNVHVVGNVGIGCDNPTEKLAVNGKIKATEIEIETTPCSDFVFEEDYELMSLSDLETFVTTNKHLPEIPSASAFKEKGGYNLAEMDDLLLRKVEQLTLYIIEMKKENEALREKVSALTTN